MQNTFKFSCLFSCFLCYVLITFLLVTCNGSSLHGRHYCGNSVIDPGEECDGETLAMLNCTSFGYSFGELSCTADCRLNTHGCSMDNCGNNTKEGDELCDGTDFGGVTCVDYSYEGGFLVCADNCHTLDTANCWNIPPTCGNGILDSEEECDDGLDNNDTEPDACRTNCHNAHCGDGVADSEEICDGNDLAGSTCEYHGFEGGALTCTDGCTIDTSSCISIISLGDQHRIRTILAVDDLYFYWGRGNDVDFELLQSEKSGSTPTIISTGYIQEITLDDIDVFWVDFNAGTVNSWNKSGGSVINLIVNQSNPDSLALDDYHVYWTNFGDGSAKLANKDGTAIITYANYQDIPHHTKSISTDGYYVHWIDGNSIRQTVLGSGTIDTIVSDWNGINGIATDENNVYWTCTNDGEILSAPNTGGSIFVLAANQARPVYLVLDETHVYWANSGTSTPISGSIAKVAKSGGTVNMLTPAQDTPSILAVDETHVYWVNEGISSVSALKRVGK